MKLIDELKEEFEKEQTSIKARGEISGVNWAEVSITNTVGSPIELGNPINKIKFSFQTLVSGAAFVKGDYRMDNHHNSNLHQHSGSSFAFIDVETLSGVLLHVLGSDVGRLK